jgi:hypothetical protein
MTTAPSPTSTWTVTSVLEQAYMMARDNFAAFITVTLIFGAVALVVDILSLGLLAGLVHLVVSVATAICLTWGALQVIAGRKPEWEPIVRQLQGPLFGRLLALGAMQYIVIALSAVLVIGPFILLPLWAVTIPAMMVERLSIGDAFQRSMDITAGRRLRILGVFVLLIVILAAGAWIIMALLGMGALAQLVLWVYTAAASTVVQTLPAILYVLLREEKERVTAQQITAALD